VATEQHDGMENAFTVDVEDYFQVSAFEGVVDRAHWNDIPTRVEDNTRRVLDLLERHGTKATCFVLGWVGERHPNLVREIARRGHTVACHGYSHRLIYDQSRAEFAEETRRAKDVLEQLVGRPVRGYRAASYSITRRSLWALDTLIELGFEYDSSVFPVRHDRYGIPDAPRFPHVIERAGGTIVEFPISTLNLAGYHLPVGGGGYFRIFPFWLSASAIAHLNHRENQPAMFYIHPWEVDPAQPRVAAGLLSRFRHYRHLAECEGRLDRLLSGARFTDTESVLAAYRRRHELPRMIYSESGVRPAAPPRLAVA
jgi:polysaccharide deacetylase family protein (PEP-CTERM system associated)